MMSQAGTGRQEGASWLWARRQPINDRQKKATPQGRIQPACGDGVAQPACGAGAAQPACGAGAAQPARPVAMQGARKRLACACIALIAAGAFAGQLFGLVPRFSVDQQNSRKITDTLEETGFPFQKLWQVDLGGKVESQPIVVDGRIYVQAGDRLVLLDMAGAILAQSPVLSDSPMPSGSSPTFAYTPFGERIYQATRDHRLWALDPHTLQPIWEGGYKLISAGERPDALYRITASPLVVPWDGKTLLALGTADGDQTGRPGQYADNGFFVLEDRGKTCEVVYARQTAGEVTGSPILCQELILATQNILADRAGEENLLLCYDLHTQQELGDAPLTPQGIPGSPASEADRVYVADRNGRMYCYERRDGEAFSMEWSAAPSGIASSYNLNSPTIGEKYVYLPIRQYRGGGGLLVAYDKGSGAIAQTLAFDSILCSNVVYWQPQGSEREFLLVYEASGRTRLLDALTLEPVRGFMDESGKIVREIMLPHAPLGVKAPEPIIGENHMLLVDGAGVLHAYRGRGQELNHEADIAVLDFIVPPTAEPGEAAQWKAVIKNLSEEPVEQVMVQWSENGRVIHRETKDFGGGESISLSFAWAGADRPGMIHAEVAAWPQEPVLDPDESNNKRWAYIRVEQPLLRADCAEVKERGAWEATYTVLAGYETRSERQDYLNAEGVWVYEIVEYTDFNSPIYRYVNVGYAESLSAELSVHTGQGRLPDPARPSAEDQEGRGAWAIIPYARGQGLDPNRVTRAGAGFTIRVETDYQTDWETKVPEGAAAIGGALSGPENVVAEFYDTRGRLVQRLALERTGGSAGIGKAHWELPMAPHAYLDGSVASRRWFYTEPGIPDGVFQVLVRVEGAGLCSLHTCEVAKVWIYGSIYDDIYERISRP